MGLNQHVNRKNKTKKHIGIQPKNIQQWYFNDQKFKIFIFSGDMVPSGKVKNRLNRKYNQVKQFEIHLIHSFK